MAQKESLADAISSALDEVTHVDPADTSTDGSDESEDLEDDLDADGGDEGDGEGDDAEGEGEGEGDGEGDDGSLDDDGGEPPEGYERDPKSGRFVKKAPVEGEQPVDGKKPDDKGKKPVEAKKPDALNDPIDKALKPETQQRIRTLIKETKEAQQARDAATQDFNFMVQGVQATGASPEQYGETLSWLALFNSPDAAQKQKAYELVESVADRMATMLGVDRQVGDPLSAHADLKEAVRTGKLTADYAKEIARTRNQAKFQGEVTASATQEQQRQQQAKQELDKARLDLSQLEAVLEETDTNWARHKRALVATLKPIFKIIPPSQWTTKFQEAYRELRNQRIIGPAKARVPANQPMRPGKGGAAGSGTRARSGTALDAVNNALENMP